MVEVVVAVAVAMGKMSYPTVSVLFFVFSTSLERKLQMVSGRKIARCWLVVGFVTDKGRTLSAFLVQNNILTVLFEFHRLFLPKTTHLHSL